MIAGAAVVADGRSHPERERRSLSRCLGIVGLGSRTFSLVCVFVLLFVVRTVERDAHSA